MSDFSKVRPKILGAAFAATALLASVQTANAVATFTGSGTVGSNSVAAEADFSLSGSTLTILLSNTSSPDGHKETPTNTLSGLAFDISGQSTKLTPQSATASSIFQAGLCSDGCATTNVAGEWGYQFNKVGISQDNLVGGAGYVTTGLTHNIGNFGPNGTAGTNLDDPNSLDGINFGIIANNTSDGLNGGLHEPLIQNSLTLTLSNLPSGFSLDDISNVLFLYGTQLGEGSIPGECVEATQCNPGGGPGPGVPEPATLFLLGSALLGYGAMRRRQQQS